MSWRSNVFLIMIKERWIVILIIIAIFVIYTILPVHLGFIIGTVIMTVFVLLIAETEYNSLPIISNTLWFMMLITFLLITGVKMYNIEYIDNKLSNIEIEEYSLKRNDSGVTLSLIDTNTKFIIMETSISVEDTAKLQTREYYFEVTESNSIFFEYPTKYYILKQKG